MARQLRQRLATTLALSSFIITAPMAWAQKKPPLLWAVRNEDYISSAVWCKTLPFILTSSATGAGNIWDAYGLKHARTMNAFSNSGYPSVSEAAGVALVIANKGLTPMVTTVSLATGEIVDSFSIPTFDVKVAAISPDGNKIALGGPFNGSLDRIEIRDRTTHALMSSTFVFRTITDLKFSNDSSRLLCAAMFLYFLDGTTAGTQGTAPSTRYNVSWSPNDQQVVGLDSSGAIRVTSATTFTDSLLFSNMNWARFHPNGSSIIGASSTGDLRTFAFPSGTLTSSFSTGGSTFRGDLSPDGNKAVINDSSGTSVWDLTTQSRVKTLCTNDRVGDAPLAADKAGMFFAVPLWKTVDVRRFSTGALVRRFQVAGQVRAVSLSSNGSRLAISQGANVVEVYDTVSGTLVSTHTATSTAIEDVQISPDGTQYAVGLIRNSNTKVVSFVRVADGVATSEFFADGSSMAWSPDGSAIYCMGTQKRAVPGGQILWSMAAPKTMLKLSPSGTRLAVVSLTSDTAILQVLDTNDGRVVSNKIMPASKSLAWTADGASILWSGSGFVAYIDPSTGAETDRYDREFGGRTCRIVSSGKVTVAVRGGDGTLLGIANLKSLKP